ncbi:ATP-binding protein, partial [candidate division KSB1 bacterium]
LNPMCLGEMEYIPFPGNLEKLLNGELPEMNDILLSPDTDILSMMIKGFMPALLDFDAQNVMLQWWDGYVRTYLERDLRQITQIESLPDFRRVMTSLALRSGQILNQTAVSRELGLSQPTVHRYINLLETSYMVERLPAFSVNRNKRLSKSPKVVWNDPALACFLSGYHKPDDLRESTIAGGVFESLVYMHLNAEIQLMTPMPRLYFWRTSTGKEVDFVIERGRSLVAIEVKLSGQVRYVDLENLKIFMEEYPETVSSIVVYTGSEIKRMDENIFAVPWYLL